MAAERTGIFALDWRGAAQFLRAKVAFRRAPLFPCVSITWDDGTQALLCDNGGEWNLVVRESEADKLMLGPWAWRSDFSVPYTSNGPSIDALTLAYRVACHVDDRRINYMARPTTEAEMEEELGRSPYYGTTPIALTCSCQFRAGHPVGPVCLACQLVRGPLPADEEP